MAINIIEATAMSKPIIFFKLNFSAKNIRPNIAVVTNIPTLFIGNTTEPSIPFDNTFKTNHMEKKFGIPNANPAIISRHLNVVFFDI